MIDAINEAIACVQPPEPIWKFTKSRWNKFELSGDLVTGAVTTSYDGLPEVLEIVKSKCIFNFNRETEKFEVNTEGVYDNTINAIIHKVTVKMQQAIQVKEPRRTKLYKWLSGASVAKYGEQFAENYFSFFKFITKNATELEDNDSKESLQLYAMAKFIRERYEKTVP